MNNDNNIIKVNHASDHLPRNRKLLPYLAKKKMNINNR